MIERKDIFALTGAIFAAPHYHIQHSQLPKTRSRFVRDGFMHAFDGLRM